MKVTFSQTLPTDQPTNQPTTRLLELLFHLLSIPHKATIYFKVYPNIDPLTRKVAVPNFEIKLTEKSDFDLQNSGSMSAFGLIFSCPEQL